MSVRELAARHGPHDQKWFRPLCNRIGQRCVGRLMRQILAAGEEPQERSTLLRLIVTNSASQHRIAGFERVEHHALCSLTLNIELNLAVDLRERAQMCRENDADHCSVWTSTESTAGRSRTIGAQLSPAFVDAYTCPPVVPKYTPHESSESTAIASRNTLT